MDIFTKLIKTIANRNNPKTIVIDIPKSYVETITLKDGATRERVVIDTNQLESKLGF